MIDLTKQEKMVLWVFVLILFFGSSLQYAFKKYPQLRDSVNLLDSDVIYQKMDLNTASLEELISLPYIGQYTAQNIIEYRQQHGLFTTVEQIKAVKGIRDKNYERFSKFLRIKN